MSEKCTCHCMRNAIIVRADLIRFGKAVRVQKGNSECI